MILARRRFLSLLPAPAIVRAASLMAIVPVTETAFKLVDFAGLRADANYTRVGDVVTITGQFEINPPLTFQWFSVVPPSA